MIAPCYDRAPYAEGAWMKVGHAVGAKPRYRWVPRWYTDRCAVRLGRGVGPNGENYAEANAYQCGGCRWEKTA